ncbi:MAG: hypothetical protein HYY16_14780 [Planctomycetes bacterium]|nr:hypothetical protein [Planctomycetota bacterium]
MRGVIASAVVLLSASVASAQNIDVFNAWGPSGTHIEHELPISSFTYQCTTTCNYSYRHEFKVWHKRALKHSESFDVINPSGSTPFSREISFSGWNLQVGDVITYRSTVVIISGPYTGQSDEDYLYGDVVDHEGFRSQPGSHPGSVLDVIDEKSRFETLLA